MNATTNESIAVSASFPDETVELVDTESVEVYLTLTNQSSEPIELTFNSGQQFDIYFYDSHQKLVNQWSNGRMFTQAFQTISLQPGQKQRFGDRMPLTDESGKPLAKGSYTIKIEVKTTTPASDALFQQIPYTAQSTLELR